jgi:CBS domain containing-hemolysin-like protein
VQSAEELRLAVDASRAAGLVDPAAEALVDRAFLFGDLEVRHAMVPRTEMVAVPADASFVEVLTAAADSGHLRLPVYEGDADRIVGVLHLKRLLRPVVRAVAGRGRPAAADGAFDARAFMDAPLVVPETARAADLLTRMRRSGTQLAVVVDEYGGTAGIVTVEDLVAEVVGEIRDELGPPEPAPAPAPDGSLVLDGLTTLAEAREYHGLDLDEEGLGVETLGGYVFARLGRPAVVGDEVAVPSGQLLRAEALDGLRVARVRVVPAQHGAGPPDQA